MTSNVKSEDLYNGPIVDAHHHFWQPGNRRYPWLLPGMAIPFRYGLYDSIKKDYMPEDLLRDAQGLNLIGSVAMEGEWDLADPLGEVAFLEQVKASGHLPTAVSAHAILRDPRVEDTLEKMAGRDIVRAIRNKPGQSDHKKGVAIRPTLMSDPAWQRGYALLQKYGLHFELQTAWWHLDEAYALASRFPGTTLIINHAGLPSDRSAEGIAGWQAAIRKISALPNVYMKISGIGLPGQPWLVENNRIIIDRIHDCFGSSRIMFASNFPVDGLVGSYADIFNGFREMARAWPRHEQEDTFYRTAVRVYGLKELARA